MATRPARLFKNPVVRANYDHLMEVAREKGLESSVEEFRKLFQEGPAEEQQEEFERRAATQARWKRRPPQGPIPGKARS